MEEERKFRESLVRSPEEVLNRTKKGSFRSGESGPNSQEDFPESGMNQSESTTGKLITLNAACRVEDPVSKAVSVHRGELRKAMGGRCSVGATRRARHKLEHTMVDYAGPFGRISSTRDDSYQYSYLLCTLYTLHMLNQCRWYLYSHLLC